MERRRIAIACQGGGSQCAFVAGALGMLLSSGVQDRFRIVGLSGTSGGALTAAVAWAGLLRQAHGDPTPARDRILALWNDLTAQTLQEIALDQWCVQLQRLVERGILPTVASSPSSFGFRLWAQAVSRLIGRPAFTDLRALLDKHLDFDELRALVRPESPVLLVSAGDVIEGTFKIFSSARDEIKVDALMASAAIPTLFPAAWVDGHAYWDGIFASNPPITGFLRRALMDGAPLPHEIWIIQINRVRHAAVPEVPSDISDRRNHLAGNLSLQHELEVIDMINLLLQEGGMTDGFRARFGIDSTEPIKVRFIRMSADLQEALDYPSKLSRQPAHIERLLQDGVTQAGLFLKQIDAGDVAPEVSAAKALNEDASGTHVRGLV